MGQDEHDRARILAASHAGVLTARQLVEAGCHPRWADRQVRRGLWQRPARGVYVPHARPLSGLDLAHAARALAGGGVVISGLVVLRELGLRWLPASDQVLALVEPTVRTPSSGRVVLRRTTDVAQLDTWLRDGVRMAPVARAVVDGARGLSLRDARGVVLGAVADGWADAADLRVHLDATQRNGSGFVRRAIGDAERGCASPPEAEVVDRLLGCGLPFYVNPELRLDGRLLGLPDIWFLGLGLGGEVDSKERHEEEDRDVESTYDRHERMTSCGIELVHLSVRRIRSDPGAAAEHLVRRAIARKWSGRSEPAGLVVVPRGPLLR